MRRALISVYDKTGVEELAAALHKAGVEIVSTGSTAATIAAAGVPVRTMNVATVDAGTLGALFMHFMLETILAGRLMGVDPFGQPAVEDGKRRARAALAGGAP